MEYLLSNINKYSECQDKTSAAKTISEFSNLIYNTNREKWSLACPPPCTQKSYSVNLKKYHTNSWIEFDAKQPGKDVSKYIAALTMSYETFVVEEQVETLVYDAGNFLAAVGGNLGLFLGFSCLTMLLGILKVVKSNLKTAIFKI